MFGQTKNINVIKTINYLKIINKNDTDKSGIKFDINLKKQTSYIFVLNGYKNCKSNIEILIVDSNYKNLTINTNKLTNKSKDHIIKFNTMDNENVIIGFMFINSKKGDSFTINNIKLMDIYHNIVFEKIYNNSNNPNNLNNLNNLNNRENIVLIIADISYMKKNLAESRYKYLNYLADNNDNVFIVGTGMNFFKPGINIHKLVNILGIKPNLIIHGNNFLKSNLLVSGLNTYPCKKILIIEDMHATDLINKVTRSNSINYIFYHCDCNQLDQLKLLNRHVRFINYPHYVDTNIYKNYGENKVYDIILYGCINKSVYPFRYRLFNLIRSCKKFRICYIPFPGYNVPNRKAITSGEKLAKLINKSYIGISTCSNFDYFLKKYIEIPASYCMVAGNIPTRYRNILSDKIIELRPTMSDTEIITRLQSALSDKDKLLEKIAYSYEFFTNNFSYEKGNETFNQIVDAIDKINTLQITS